MIMRFSPADQSPILPLTVEPPVPRPPKGRRQGKTKGMTMKICANLLPVRAAAAFSAGLMVCLAGASATDAGPIFRPQAGRRTVENPVPSVRSQVSDFHSYLVLPPPTQLKNTNEQTVCSAHGGFAAGLACKALLPQGRLALVWDYPARDDVVGFHIYRVDGGQSALVYDQANGAKVKVYVVDPPPADGYAAACYAVAAYSATQESAPSAPFCGNQARINQTVSLTPQVWRLGTGYHMKDTHLGNYDNSQRSGTAAGTGAPTVGYSYTTHKTSWGDKSYDMIDRLGLKFDLQSLAGGNKHIVSAHLKMRVDSSWTGENYLTGTSYDHPAASDHRTSCLAKVGVGVSYWENYSDWIEDAVVSQPGIMNGPNISVDVTRIVTDWVENGQTNYGFVLEGEEENLEAFTEKSCITTYLPDSLQLDITYD